LALTIPNFPDDEVPEGVDGGMIIFEIKKGFGSKEGSLEFGTKRSIGKLGFPFNWVGLDFGEGVG